MLTGCEGVGEGGGSMRERELKIDKHSVVCKVLSR